MDFWLRVAAILAIGGGAFFILRKIDPLAGKDYSGVSPRTKRATIVVIAAVAALLLLLKSGPSSLDECRAAAARLPTDTGVRVALGDCARRFPSSH